jgi:protein SCO1
MNIARRKILVASAAVVATGALTLAGRDLLRDSSDNDAATDLAAARLAGYFPNVILTTQGGRKVRFYDDLLRDKSTVIGFFYTECDNTCPLTMANLIDLRKTLHKSGREDMHVYAITVDPANDTPNALAAYAKHLGSGDGITFLTGQPADLKLVRRKLGVFHPDPVSDGDRNQHSGLIVIGNEPSGRWARLPSLVPTKRIMRTVARVAPAARV